MLMKAMLCGAISTFCSPAVCDELRSYTVTVMEQIRHEITVEASEEYAARTDALLEARRTSGSGKPWWEPSPPTVLAHARQAGGFAVIAHDDRQQRPQMFDLRQNGLHSCRRLDQHHHRKGLKCDVDLNILLFVVVVQVELMGLQAVDNVAGAVRDQHRSNDVRGCDSKRLF